jgi:hypothetical protein
LKTKEKKKKTLKTKGKLGIEEEEIEKQSKNKMPHLTNSRLSQVQKYILKFRNLSP